MKRSFTTLTEATLITAVVQQGYGEIITDALLEVGIQGSTVHGAMGVGIRERLGALGVAVDAERDVVNVMVSSDEVDTQQLQNLVTLHQPNEMYDTKKPMFQFNLNYLFIADDPCLMEILPPFMHMDKFPGEVIGGSYNIHSWIRSISWGFVFANTKNKLVIKRGDPLCYVKFTTPKLNSFVQLKECILTDDIIKELDRKRFLTQFKKGGIINLMSRALKLRPKKLIKIKPKL